MPSNEDVPSESNIDSSVRRPVKTRQWLIFQSLAQMLVRLRISPNLISTFSVVAGTLAGGSLATTSLVNTSWIQNVLWIFAALFIQLRLISNLLDGLVAVEGGMGSPVGELFNEVPDRISDSAIFIGAGFAIGSTPLWGFAAALTSMFVAYVRVFGASVGVGQVFLGPFAKQQRMAIMTVLCLVSAAFPMNTMIAKLGYSFGFVTFTLFVICLGNGVTAVRRLCVIASRMNSKGSSVEQSE